VRYFTDSSGVLRSLRRKKETSMNLWKQEWAGWKSIVMRERVVLGLTGDCNTADLGVRTPATPGDLNAGWEYQEGMGWTRRSESEWSCKKKFEQVQYRLRNAKRHGGHWLLHCSIKNIMKKMTCSKTLRHWLWNDEWKLIFKYNIHFIQNPCFWPSEQLRALHQTGRPVQSGAARGEKLANSCFFIFSTSAFSFFARSLDLRAPALALWIFGAFIFHLFALTRATARNMSGVHVWRNPH
jgi:hypothetical protein